MPKFRHADTVNIVDLESARFRFRYFSQIQIWILTALLGWTPAIIKLPVSINIGHRRFNYHRYPNLNLREISESESEANSTHVNGHTFNSPNIMYTIVFLLLLYSDVLRMPYLVAIHRQICKVD